MLPNIGYIECLIFSRIIEVLKFMIRNLPKLLYSFNVLIIMPYRWTNFSSTIIINDCTTIVLDTLYKYYT